MLRIMRLLACLALLLPAGLFWLCLTSSVQGADLAPARQALLSGRYEDCIRLSGAKISDSPEAFADLKSQAEITLGKYDEAWLTLTRALGLAPQSIRLRWAAVQLAPYVNQADNARRYRNEVENLIQNAAWRYTRESADLIVLAEVTLKHGANPRQVQTALLKRARELHPEDREPLLALAGLALEKQDFALAADTCRTARELFPEDPEFAFLLAQALVESDPRGARDLIEQTLQHNPRHVGALLLQASQAIDGEQYAAAGTLLERILQINARHPDALALQAAISFLQGDEKQADALRMQALATWGRNPHVDHLYGRKLSQKYRFEEGAAAQRRALEMQADYRPARKQLAEDLLRLGHEQEGWEMIQLAHAQDEYDVTTYNLLTLQQELDRFALIEEPGWKIRMDRQEAAIYGRRVVELLKSARQQLCKKYDVTLEDTITVEIFPKPADFAVRTFGMPGAGGYLGVCFGDVITARSPASQQANPINWESVLWHEFAHVVTLNKTRNRMPRWLSEGISVYEERQHDPRWGEQMNAGYRQRILEGKLTPVSGLSDAFLKPSSSSDLMFAYFESSLVVEYLIRDYGLESVQAILSDLGQGIPVNETIERHTTSLQALESDFAAYAKGRALAYGWHLDWRPVKFEPLLKGPHPDQNLMTWARRNPAHYQGRLLAAQMLIKLNQPEKARQLLDEAALLFPQAPGDDSALAQVAALRRAQGDSDGERTALLQVAAVSSTASASLIRLLEIERDRQNWPGLQQQASRLIEVNPLIPQPYQAQSQAAEQLNDVSQALTALETLLQLAPSDPADLHYRLAVQLHKANRQEEARRAVLQALEQAPRFRKALSLLVDLQNSESSSAEMK